MKISQTVMVSDLVEIKDFDHLTEFDGKFVNLEVVDKRNGVSRFKKFDGVKVTLVGNPSVVQGEPRRVYIAKYWQTPKWDAVFNEDTAEFGSSMMVRLEVLF